MRPLRQAREAESVNTGSVLKLGGHWVRMDKEHGGSRGQRAEGTGEQKSRWGGEQPWDQASPPYPFTMASWAPVSPAPPSPSGLRPPPQRFHPERAPLSHRWGGLLQKGGAPPRGRGGRRVGAPEEVLRDIQLPVTLALWSGPPSLTPSPCRDSPPPSPLHHPVLILCTASLAGEHLVAVPSLHVSPLQAGAYYSCPPCLAPFSDSQSVPNWF